MTAVLKNLRADFVESTQLSGLYLVSNRHPVIIKKPKLSRTFMTAGRVSHIHSRVVAISANRKLRSGFRQHARQQCHVASIQENDGLVRIAHRVLRAPLFLSPEL